MLKDTVRLGVNIDHVATLRQVRGVNYPDPVKAAHLAVRAGADGITLHLREDRRHIQDRDLAGLKENGTIPINLEMAITEEMLRIAETMRPACCCLVPEKRDELTTEGGLDVIAQVQQISEACQRLAAANIQVSLFIDADHAQIDAAKRCRVPTIELHTGSYADAKTMDAQKREYETLKAAAIYANQQGFIVNAGHGLHYKNVQAIAALPMIYELNIGHSIVARAVMVGMEAAVREMKALMNMAHQCLQSSELR